MDVSIFQREKFIEVIIIMYDFRMNEKIYTIYIYSKKVLFNLSHTLSHKILYSQSIFK